MALSLSHAEIQKGLDPTRERFSSDFNNGFIFSVYWRNLVWFCKTIDRSIEKVLGISGIFLRGIPRSRALVSASVIF
jgi:hypothetical protein